jgi:hypothetical protein
MNRSKIVSLKLISYEGILLLNQDFFFIEKVLNIRKWYFIEAKIIILSMASLKVILKFLVGLIFDL